jgi:hypothetical protein
MFKYININKKYQSISKNILNALLHVKISFNGLFQISVLIIRMKLIINRRRLKSKVNSFFIVELMTSLWKIGVMPYSKHTQNLDYQRYVEGLLGFENAVNLIFNLCQLASDCNNIKKSKDDQNFGLFLSEIFANI